MNIYRPVWHDQSIERLLGILSEDMLTAPSVDTGHWQAKKDVDQTQTRELLNVVIEMPINGSPGGWASYMRPNLPWAETHFKERVSGEPLNPPPSASNWPFAQRDNEDFKQQGAFSHSYPERLWSRFAPDGAKELGFKVNRGVRYEHGDLHDAIHLLIQEPHTRQCFIPIWFPEDLHAAAVEHQRVPCTLGYHMMMRQGQLHCFYPMRSLDLLRYFKDDAYMAGRLCQWVIEQCRIHSNENSVWQEVQPGILTMHAVSLHIFERDVPIIKAMRHKKERVA